MLARLLFIASFLSFFAHSAIVLKVKGNKCLVHLEDTSAHAGDYFQALDLYGNVSGIVRLNKVKNGKAIATIVEGTVGTNWILEQTNKQTIQKSPSFDQIKSSKSMGFLASANLNMAKRKYIDSDKIQRFSGIGGSGFIFANFNIMNSLALDIQLGANYFSAEESSSSTRIRPVNNCRGTCRAWVWWLPDVRISLQLKVPISQNVQLWLGGGFSTAWWGRNDEEYVLFSKNTIDNFQGSMHLSIGSNIYLRQGISIPIALSVAQVDPFGLFSGRFFKRSQSNNPVYISQFLLQMGVSKSF